MAEFPILSKGQDSRYYDMQPENPAMGSEMEGGYVFTRPRFTRTPRKRFKTGFTDITQDDRLILESFWNEVKGSSNAFLWTDPTDGRVYNVRFPLDYPGFRFVYKGFGETRRYDVPDIQLEEV